MDFRTNSDISGWSTSGNGAAHYPKKGYLMWYMYLGNIKSTSYFTKPVHLPDGESADIQYSAVFYAANTGASHGKGTFYAGVTSSTSVLAKDKNTGSITTSNVSNSMDNKNTACSNPVTLSSTGKFQKGYMLSFCTGEEDGGKFWGVYSVETGLFIASVNISYK